MADSKDVITNHPLSVHGNVELGIDLEGPEYDESIRPSVG